MKDKVEKKIFLVYNDSDKRNPMQSWAADQYALSLSTLLLKLLLHDFFDLFISQLRIFICIFQELKVLLKFVIFSQAVFSVCPLSVKEWLVVLKISFPVIILDETMKFFSRKFVEGRNPFSELHWMLAMWALYIALMIYAPI